MAILAALTAVLLLPALGADDVLYFRDVSQNHQPYRQLTAATVAGGEAPLWNPWRGAGQPLLANPNALVLHPTTLLFLFLPLPTALDLSVVMMIFLAGAGTWLVLRDMGASRLAALLGAASFAFSGYVVSLGNLMNLLDAVSFMPLTLWLAGRAIRVRLAPWGPLAALSLAVQILAGEPLLLACTFLGLVPLLCGGSGTGARAGWGGFRGAGSLGIIIVLALGLSMAGLLPTLELLARSERGAGFEAADSLKWSLPPAALGEMAFPSLFGDPTRIGVDAFWGSGLHDSGLPLILSIHLGGAVLVLAAAGFWSGLFGARPRRHETIVLAALAALGIALALGRFLPLLPALLALPGTGWVRYPVKFLLLTVWAVPLLAARGVDAAREAHAARERESRRPVTGAGAALAAIAAAGLALMVSGASWLAIPAQLATPYALAAVARGMREAVVVGLVPAAAVFALIAAGWARRSHRPMRSIAIGLTCIPIASLMLCSVGLNPVSPASFYEEEPRLASVLGPAAQDGRLWAVPRPRGFAFRTPMEWDSDSLRWGFRWDRMTLRNATYFSTGYRFAFDRGNERLDVMPGAAVGRDLYDRAGAGTMSPEMVRMLSLAGVDRVIVYGENGAAGLVEETRLAGESNIPVVILRNENALPRAYVVHEVESISGPDEALERVLDPGFDPRRAAVVEGAAAPALPDAIPARNGPESSAMIVEESANRVMIRAALSRPGHLILADTYYPGWVATVDGARAPILRANAMFRAVALAAGDHDVEFRYRPTSVTAGLLCSIVSMIAALGVVALAGRK